MYYPAIVYIYTLKFIGNLFFRKKWTQWRLQLNQILLQLAMTILTPGSKTRVSTRAMENVFTSRTWDFKVKFDPAFQGISKGVVIVDQEKSMVKTVKKQKSHQLQSSPLPLG